MEAEVRVPDGHKEVKLDPQWFRWRREGRMIFAQLDPDVPEDDPLIGLMASPELARGIVELHNGTLNRVLREEFSADGDGRRDGAHLPHRARAGA